MTVQSIDDLAIFPDSRVSADGADWALADSADGVRLLVVAAHRSPSWLSELDGAATAHGRGTILVGPTTARNAEALRRHLPWLAPKPLGLRTSAGMGDRLGLATPGHVRAVKSVGTIAPVFGQQSIREMTRTGRTPQQVIDDATWGTFRGGWQRDVGADADHLKTTADIDACAQAGFSLFTIDPGSHVVPAADTSSLADLGQRFADLPWRALDDTPDALRARYVGRTVDVEGRAIAFDDQTTLKAAVKYGRAVSHVVAMGRHLAAVRPGGAFEIEVSVDETDTPTSPAEHVYIATELRRLGLKWVSLAPRFVGRFEKGVDYIGDLRAFRADCAAHAAIARCFGPYKLSLHSGSDKFSIYGTVAAETRGLVHLKTAGTSYLEALRTIASVDRPLFREIYRLARGRYDTDRASYHVSADVSRTPAPESVADDALPTLLEHFDAREVLHVTFGSVLTLRSDDGSFALRDRLLAALRAHPDEYGAALERHFVRHLQPFAQHARV